MAPSEVKRFAAYLNGLSQRSSTRPVAPESSPRASGTDFEETQELLQLFEDDERVRRVLLDTSEATLCSTLATVQDTLEQVESTSIEAYIHESTALNELHEQVKPPAAVSHPRPCHPHAIPSPCLCVHLLRRQLVHPCRSTDATPTSARRRVA